MEIQTHEELNIEDPEYLHDIMEHEDSRINPELEEGDIVIVIEVDGEHNRMTRNLLAVREP